MGGSAWHGEPRLAWCQSDYHLRISPVLGDSNVPMVLGINLCTRQRRHPVCSGVYPFNQFPGTRCTSMVHTGLIKCHRLAREKLLTTACIAAGELVCCTSCVLRVSLTGTKRQRLQNGYLYWVLLSPHHAVCAGLPGCLVPLAMGIAERARDGGFL